MISLFSFMHCQAATWPVSVLTNVSIKTHTFSRKKEYKYFVAGNFGFNY